MSKSGAQSATLRVAQSAALRVALEFPHSLALAITRERKTTRRVSPGARAKWTRTSSGASVFAQRETQHFFVFILTRHFSPISCSLCAPFSPSLSHTELVIVAKRHTVPKKQTTDPATTHALSLALSLLENKKTRHLFGFLMVFLRSRTTINYDLF